MRRITPAAHPPYILAEPVFERTLLDSADRLLLAHPGIRAHVR